MTTVPATPLNEIRDTSPSLAPSGSPGNLLTAEKLRAWGPKSAYSLVDQALTSLTGFCVSFLLARWMPAEVYGAFAVAFTGYVFVCGFYNVIVLEPMSVMGPSRHAGRLHAYFREQIVIHAGLVGVLSTIVLVAGLIVWRVAPHTPLVGAISGSSLALPFLLLLWLVRRLCYVMNRPSAAIFGSAAYLSLVVSGLYALRGLGRLSPFFAFVLTGTASLLAAALVIRRLRMASRRDQASAHIAWRTALRENWAYGRWLAGSTVLYSISAQTQMFLAASLLGLGAAGVLRAMQLPALVMTQVVTAAGLLVLPALSRDFAHGSIERMRRKAMLVSASLAGTAVGFAGLLMALAGRIEHLLFGGKYAAFAWLIPVLALMPVADAAASGFLMALRASQQPQFDLITNAVAAPVGLLSAVFFMHWWGLAGAAFSLVAGCFASALANFCAYRYFTARARKATEAITCAA
jgi:hypothetical protein